MIGERNDQKNISLETHNLIFNFLNSNQYTKTLESFKSDANENLDLNDEGGIKTFSSKLPDLRTIIEDYLLNQSKLIQQSQSSTKSIEPLEDLLNNLTLNTSSTSSTSNKLPSKVSHTLRESTNFLSIRSGVLPRRQFDSTQGRFISQSIPCLFSTSVDKTLKLRSTLVPFDLLDTYSFTSPILSTASNPLEPRYIVAAAIEGSLTLIDLVSRKVLQKLQGHSKYVIKTVWSQDGQWVASIGYDKIILVYKVVVTESKDDEEVILLEGEEADALASNPRVELVQSFSHSTKSNPEGVAFLPGSDFLVFAAREDNLLRYVALPGKEVDDEKDWKITSYNLNPNGDAWVSFSILYITIHPTLPLVCLQTSTENSRLLLYPFHSAQRLSTFYTTIEQGDYSTPKHCWLKNGTGVIFTSEDGIVRLLDMKGKVALKIGAHGGASPMEEGQEESRSELVRRRKEVDKGSSVIKEVTVWENEEGKVSFASCGFDRTIKIFEA